jgi:ATP-binding cassette, subfamily B, multidrug efflux pump
MRELQYLNKYFIKYRYRFLLGIVTTVACQYYRLFAPRYISKTIDGLEFIKNSKTVLKQDVESDIQFFILVILGTTLLAGLLSFFSRQILIVMSRFIEFDMKNEIFSQYERLTQSFYKRNRTGDLMNRISEDVSKVRMYIGPAVMYTANTLFTFAFVIFYMFKTSPLLTFYTLLPLPLLSYLIFRISNEINKRSKDVQENLSALSSLSQEIFSGVRVIKAYSLESNFEKNVAQMSEENRQKSMRLAKINSYFGPLMIALIGVSNIIVIYVGGKMYIDGSHGITKIGTIAEFIIYVNMLTWPVASLGWVSSMVQEAAASQKRINEFLKIEPEIKNEHSERSVIQGAINFSNVSFTYEDTNINALKNISFTIKKGETLAIIGKTGSGKSTILSLISRIIEPSTGSIYIDGKDIKNLNLYDLRSNVGVVPQDAFLFSDSIENNIKFGDENATHKEVVAAAKKAVVHDNIVAFKDQYETVLGERGITLSGGQKQRISIARALIKNPEILLLDDCLSAVDTETEELILQNLLEFCKDKTTIIVSHRVSSAKNAHQIIVVHEGEIIEQGTHNQLIEQNGYYADLCDKQLSEKELS